MRERVLQRQGTVGIPVRGDLHLEPGHLGDPRCPRRWLVDPDRDVHPARGEDPQHGDHLVGPLGQRDPDRVARRDSPVEQSGAHAQRLVGELAVGQAAVLSPEHRRRFRLGGGMGEEVLVQQPPRPGTRGLVDTVADGGLRGRDHPVDLRAPRVGLSGEPFDQRGEGREHRRHHAFGELPLPHVPVHQQPVGDLGDLRVEQHLRPLRDDPHRLAEQLPHATGEELAEVQGAGEDHRRQHLASGAARQVPQHLHSGVLGVRGVGVQALLGGADAVGEGERLGEVDGQQHRAREVADQEVDVGVHRRPVEHRHVDQETRLGAPGTENFGEGRGDRGGQGHAVPASRAFQQVALLGRQEHVLPDDPGPARCRELRGHRQLRCARKAGKPRRPVLRRTRRRVIAAFRTRGQVFAVAVPDRREGRIRLGVQARQVRQEDPVADRVGGDHVDVQVEPRPPAGEQAQDGRQHLTGLDVEHLVGHRVAGALQALLDLRVRCVAEVPHHQTTPARLRADPLAPVVTDADPQHVVPLHQMRQRGAQPVRVDAGSVELGVEMGGHSAQLLVSGASHPVGVLHQREVELRVGCAARVLHRTVVLGLSGRLVPVGQQPRPVPHGGPVRQLGEVGLDTGLPPAAHQLHEVDRIEAELEEVRAGADVLRFLLDELGQHRAQPVLAQVGRLHFFHSVTFQVNTGADSATSGRCPCIPPPSNER